MEEKVRWKLWKGEVIREGANPLHQDSGDERCGRKEDTGVPREEEGDEIDPADFSVRLAVFFRDLPVAFSHFP
jgi:hypothetical protein